MGVTEEHHAQRGDASRAAATRLAEALQHRLSRDARAALVLSGGSTPQECLQLLSARRLDWSRVDVTLSDERWVSAADPDSNEAMVRRSLLVDAAASANFVPLYREGRTVPEACPDIELALRALPSPFAATLLGMGEDGHFASLFPGMPGLEQALSVGDGDGGDAQRLCVPALAGSGPSTRVSLTLAALLGADEIVLLMFGERKQQIYERARDTAARYPVSALLGQTRTPVRVIWAP